MSTGAPRLPLRAGDRFAIEHTFTVEEVAAFIKISGDAGAHHVTPDAHGRVVAHGLLTATLPTRIGDMIDYVAREMNLEFIRPVYTGDTIHCEVVWTEVLDEDRLYRLRAEIVMRNQLGKEVLKAKTHGVIFKKPPLDTPDK